MRPARMRSSGPPRTLTSAVGIPSLEHFKNGFRMQPSMVLHVTLEYTVPHMGFTTALTYGGLGKVCGVSASTKNAGNKEGFWHFLLAGGNGKEVTKPEELASFCPLG